MSYEIEKMRLQCELAGTAMIGYAMAKAAGMGNAINPRPIADVAIEFAEKIVNHFSILALETANSAESVTIHGESFSSEEPLTIDNSVPPFRYGDIVEYVDPDSPVQHLMGFRFIVDDCGVFSDSNEFKVKFQAQINEWLPAKLFKISDWYCDQRGAPFKKGDIVRIKHNATISKEELARGKLFSVETCVKITNDGPWELLIENGGLCWFDAGIFEIAGPVPVAKGFGLPPIPAGIYFNAEAANFFNFARSGMGWRFHEQWHDRCSEFPTEPAPPSVRLPGDPAPEEKTDLSDSKAAAIAYEKFRTANDQHAWDWANLSLNERKFWIDLIQVCKRVFIPIPKGVYRQDFADGRKNFVTWERAPMGGEFYEQWVLRASEFPALPL